MTLDMNVMAFWQNKLKAIGPRLTATDSHTQPNLLTYYKTKLRILVLTLSNFPLKLIGVFKAAVPLRMIQQKKRYQI